MWRCADQRKGCRPPVSVAYRRERLADPHEPCDKLQRDLHRQRCQARARRRLEHARCSGIGGRGGGALREEECKPAPLTIDRSIDRSVDDGLGGFSAQRTVGL
jgi:hypothetical protein